MDVNLSAFSRRLDDLIGRFADLGAKLGEAASELQSGGAPPGDSLVDALAAARLDFVELRAEIVLAAETLGVAVPESIESAKTLEPVLAAMATVVETQRRRIAFDDARNRIVAVLDRIDGVRHEDDDDFGPLVTVKIKAEGLKRVAVALTEDGAAELPALEASTQPFADLLTMLERTHGLDDEKFSALEDSVGRTLGRQIVVAAARHRLLLPGQAPRVREPQPPEPEPVRSEAPQNDPSGLLRLADALRTSEGAGASSLEPAVVGAGEPSESLHTPPAEIEPIGEAEPVATPDESAGTVADPVYQAETVQAEHTSPALEAADSTYATEVPDSTYATESLQASDPIDTTERAETAEAPEPAAVAEALLSDDLPQTTEPADIADAVPAAEPLQAAEPVAIADAVPVAEPPQAAEPVAIADAVPVGEPLQAAEPVVIADADVAEPPPAAEPVVIADADVAEPPPAAEPVVVADAVPATEPAAVAEAVPTAEALEAAEPLEAEELFEAAEPAAVAEALQSAEAVPDAPPVQTAEPEPDTNTLPTAEFVSPPEPLGAAEPVDAPEPAEAVETASPSASQEPSGPDETAQWWLAAWARWSGWKNSLRFPEAVREELSKYPHMLSVPVQESPEHEEGLLAYGYSILLDHVEREKPGAIGSALNALKTGQAEPVGAQLYTYLVAQGRLHETYPDFIKNVLVAAVPEPGPWLQARIIHSNDDTRVFQRPSLRVGETQQTARRYLADSQRFREHKFVGTLGPLTTRFFMIQADLNDAHRVDARLTVDNASSDSALLLALPAGKTGKPDVRRFEAHETPVMGLGRDYRAVWFAIFNADPARRADFELGLTLRKDTRSRRK